jgi:haloalkane dehalogenase
MKALRTPEERFLNLPGYDFEAHYVTVDDMRVHYVDEGPADAAPVLLLHGEPSWSYLYRSMIPPIAEAGLRAIAPDLVGFGKSDKPAEQSDYSYEKHVSWMKTLLEQLDLQNITLVCQDWGSLIGLRLAAENEQRFDRIVLANGGLPTGDGKMPTVFRIWRAFARFSPWFPIGRIVQAGTVSEMPPEVVAAYDAPFPDSSYKAGARAFPKLVPTTPDDPAAPANGAAWDVFRNWQKPFLTSFSDGDPITRGLDKVFVKRVPGAKNQPHTTIEGAGHFLQEEKWPEFAKLIIDFIKSQ